MMIIITPQDLAKMSPELREELKRILFEAEPPALSNEDYSFQEIPLEEHDYLFSAPLHEPPSIHEADNPLNKKKEVIGINEVQAADLIANLSNKSITTLKLFTIDDPVGVSDLIGSGKPYSTYVELKRSFVGPVNRRLRTVTRNRNAVLFLKVVGDNEDGQISVKPVTVNALQSVLKD
jgi:hypothetical protein